MSRIQSRYRRNVADLPWAGVAMCLLLQVRRFWCDNPQCPRTIFCERLGLQTAAYARRTQRLDLLFQRVSLALGGETGACLLRALTLAASPDTLLRLIRHLGEIPVLPFAYWAAMIGRGGLTFYHKSKR